MFPLNWHRLLSLFLWISPHVLLGVVAAIVWKRRLSREFPCFFVFLLYEIAVFILMFVLYSIPSVTGEQYAYAYSATLLLGVALRFGVIAEVLKDLFREYAFLGLVARRSLQGVTGLLVVVSVLLAVYAPGDSSARWFAGVSVINRGAAVVQSGLLLSLLLLSLFFGLSWRRFAFGITLGLGILSSVDLAGYALRAEFTSKVATGYLNLLTTGTFFVCVSIWLGYLLVREASPASPTVVPEDEVETWNKEFQQLLRQ